MYDMQLNGKERSVLPMIGQPNPGMLAESSQEDYVLSLRDLLQVIRRRLWVVVLVAIICVVGVVGYSLTQTPQYQASVQILVGQKQGIVSDNPSYATGLQQLTKTVAKLVGTQPVAEEVIRRLDLQVAPEDFLKNVSVEQLTDTQTIRVSYKDSNPQRAQQIANTIGDVFSEQVSEVSPETNAITTTVWERATLPDSPISPKPVRNGVLALAVGIMLGLGLAFLLERLDDSWRSPEEVEQISGVPTFGVIRAFEIPKNKAKSKKERGIDGPSS